MTLVKVVLKLQGKADVELQISPSLTIEALKKKIYDENISKELKPADMSLSNSGTTLTNNKKISELVKTNNKIEIIQQKRTISSCSGINVDTTSIDPISLEVGFAIMSCGHSVGRDCMTGLIRSLISQFKYQIRCPNKDTFNNPCQQIWDFNICKKIGVFTQTQLNEFEEGLSLNWIKNFTKKCPNCKNYITKVGIDINRVKCPSCKYGDFCYLCLGRWVGPTNLFCGNQICKFRNDFLAKAKMNKEFKLKIKGTNDFKTVTTPQFRSCPHCKSVIEHIKACKHVECRDCRNSFCWVCLSIKDKAKGWPCGAYNDQCPKIAPIQNFNA